MPTSLKGQKPPKLRLKLANECQNLLDRVKLNPSNEEYKYYLIHSKDINGLIFSKLMVLFECLMRKMYENSSWGWNEVEKLAEWRHSRTRVIIVTKNGQTEETCHMRSLYGQLPQADESIIGFMCFRYETGADRKECALYVYELHVDIDYQRQGLGQELMKMAKALAIGFEMDKIMLTVFKSNAPAFKFYNKLGYIRDKSSPFDSDFVILSLKLKKQSL